MKKTLIIVLIFGVIAYACKHAIVNPVDPGTGGGTGGGVTPPVTDEVCFESQILPIFQNNCAVSGCHDVTTHREGVILNSYANIMGSDVIEPGDPNDSELYERITDNDPDDRMPYQRPPLPADKIELIRKWIVQGAKNTTGCATAQACDTTQFTYTAIKTTIIDQTCIGCHSGPSPSGGLNYSTYAGLKTVADNGRLLGAVSHATGYTPMPFQQPKLSDCKVTQIKKWIQSGAPNN